MHRISRAWIHAHKTPRGGWTRAQLAEIGVTWPPLHGWMDRVSGTEISDEQRARFEAHSAEPYRPVWAQPRGAA